MQITGRDLVTIIHGMLFGGLFLMACFGVLVLLHGSLSSRGGAELTVAGRRRERIFLVAMVVLGWGAVLSGAYFVYPWYRAIPPAGVTNPGAYPQRLLLADPHTAGWHTLGMEWKEHVAWMAPILMTMVAFVLMKYEGVGEEHRRVRSTAVVFALVALLAGAVAAGFGALIDKQAPVTGGSTINLMRGAR